MFARTTGKRARVNGITGADGLPAMRFTVVWEHTVLPYGVDCADRIQTVRRVVAPYGIHF
ncbi:hypothetical protein K350107B32_23470 [Agathobaculum butyriciproducens]